MDDFNELLHPLWVSEKWILEGWEKIDAHDKELIKKHMEELFKNGLPFEVKHDKLLYVYSFSLLTQLTRLAIQVPLKFKDKTSSQENKKWLHAQLLEAIFHSLAFTKILYILCTPYTVPPEHNANIEILCNVLRNEECPKTAVILSLIIKGWIAELFTCYARQDIAPKIFNIILNNEHQHIDEANLYHDINLPIQNEMKQKIDYLEEQLLVNLFLQHQYVLTAFSLLGIEGTSNFMQSLNTRYTQQLKKIHIQPGNKWVLFMQLAQISMRKILDYAQTYEEIEMTPMRKVLMAQWNNPNDATMTSQSNVDVSCIDFFGKKYPPETLTTLMMQTVSLWLKENELYCTHLHYKKLYRSKNAYVGVVVQLPGCQDQIATIAFKDCHEMTLSELAQRIRDIIPMMVYCYKRCEELEKNHPHLKLYEEQKLFDFAYDIYGCPMPGSSIVTLSNIGPWGYTYGQSPLFKNEAMKLVMLQVERRQVWNNKTQAFEIQDHLPLSISADHRLFDGNTPVPQILNDSFQRMFQKMQHDSENILPQTSNELLHFIKTAEAMLSLNIDFGYQCLSSLQITWLDFLGPDKLFASIEAIKKNMGAI